MPSGPISAPSKSTVPWTLIRFAAQKGAAEILLYRPVVCGLTGKALRRLGSTGRIPITDVGGSYINSTASGSPSALKAASFK